MTERVTSGLTWRGLETDFTVRLVRHRQTKETVTDRRHLRNTAPVLDPTILVSDNHHFMSRPLRIQFPGAVYHVMNRGGARQATFLERR